MTSKTIKEVVEISVDKSTLSEMEKADSLSVEVKSLSINNSAEYENSGEFLKKVKTAHKSIDDSRKDITRPLDEAKKRVMEFFRDPLVRLSDAESILKKALLTYQQEQERIAQEAEKKALQAAKEEEDKVRKDLERKAKAAEKKGDTKKADLLKEAAQEVYVPTTIQAPAFEKVKGISTKKVWKFRVKDASKIPCAYMLPNESMLNKMAVATKGQAPIPGIEFYCEDVISAGRG